MEDDNIIPYDPSPTLTVKQAVMYILGHRGEYSFMADTELLEFDLPDYLHNLQEESDCAFNKASHELQLLKQNANASPEAIKIAEKKVVSTKAKLEKANKLPDVAENYRLLIDHEITRVRLGKRTPLVVDEDESASSGQPRINTASFQEWLEEMELGDATEDYAPVALPVDEDAFDKQLSRKSAVSLHVTLGLLVSLFAESGGSKLGSGQEPNVSNIAKEITKYAEQRNGNHPLVGQGAERIKDRIELALSALYTSV